MSIVKLKFKEVFFSVLPVTLIVLILNFTLVPMEPNLVVRFVIGAAFMIIGLTIFLIGVDVGIIPIGNAMGKGITKSNKLWIVALAGALLGFIISVAEPDLHILANQVETVTAGQIPQATILVVVSLGIAVLLAVGLIRIVHKIPLYKLLTVLYGVIFVLAIFTSPEFLAISFDASGATTGALTVPFILALSLGISKIRKDSKGSEEDSFGLVAVSSTGAIIAVMLMSIISKQEKISGSLEMANSTSGIIRPFLEKIPATTYEVVVALLPIVALFLIFQKISFKIPKSNIKKIMFGVLFTLIGLVMFLVGVSAGFMETGSVLGYKLAIMKNKSFIVVIAFVLGMVTILAEPAVHVLTQQVEEVTSGTVSPNIVMVSLGIGVALAVSLSIVRILVPGLELWHYLLPGYLISIALTYIVPELFVGIAFDSGGVASGPMAATFILAFAQGAAEGIEGANVMVDGFGIIAMIAMAPLITLQILGFIYKMKSKRRGV
ncbi:DUF1538 domain-containing protein [Peptostreptococcus faecalis]|uniref:DUF1538 domain-containing protein n=1 Tax=Peptostreptococcus faecalis TaxID=2045015 RepID=UPI000C7C8500|nr:DUF1538 domain-containing protein [Peptostreptococcus faecalis]